MNKGYDRRKQLFDKFSDQLLLLKEHKLIKCNFKSARPYLCPICLDEFSESDLTNNPQVNFLTLEDAPPESLGGSKIALTCKTCNSRCGHEIDCHLTEAIRETDRSYFYKGTELHTTIDFEGKQLTVKLSSKGNGTLTAYHRIKSNHPKFLDRFIYGIKAKDVGPLLNFNPPKSSVNSKRVSYALLKAHYIITFAKFGYIFLLDRAFDLIREQIKNPEKEIFPYSPFIKNQFSDTTIGTYYVHNKGIEAIFNIFILKTEYSETIFGGLLPIPSITFQTFAERIEQIKDHNQCISLETSHYDPNANLFNNINEIMKIKNWIERT